MKNFFIMLCLPIINAKTDLIDLQRSAIVGVLSGVAVGVISSPLKGIFIGGVATFVLSIYKNRRRKMISKIKNEIKVLREQNDMLEMKIEEERLLYAKEEEMMHEMIDEKRRNINRLKNKINEQLLNLHS